MKSIYTFSRSSNRGPHKVCSGSVCYHLRPYDRYDLVQSSYHPYWKKVSSPSVSPVEVSSSFFVRFWDFLKSFFRKIYEKIFGL